MHAILDARSSRSLWKLYDVALFERLLRQLDVAGVSKASILTDSGKPLPLRYDFGRYRIKIEWIVPGSLFESFLQDTDVVILQADVAYDQEILTHLITSNRSLRVTDGTAESPLALRLSGARLTGTVSSERLVQLASNAGVARVNTTELKTYIRFLRRDVIPVMIRVPDPAALRQTENFFFERTFKGGMEWVAAYGYKIPVREMTRWIARTPITPNMVTALGTFCKIAAIPAFFFGALGWGLLLASAFTILDSLDGKLARMTFRFSRIADRVDHLTSAPARMGWHFGLAWYFNNGDFTTPMGWAGLAYGLLPQIDKFTTMAFNTKFKRSPIDYTELDARVHLYTVRRNDLALLSLGYIAGFAKEAFLIAMVWMALTWLWHAWRLLWFWLIRPQTGNVE